MRDWITWWYGHSRPADAHVHRAELPACPAVVSSSTVTQKQSVAHRLLWQQHTWQTVAPNHHEDTLAVPLLLLSNRRVIGLMYTAKDAHVSLNVWMNQTRRSSASWDSWTRYFSIIYIPVHFHSAFIFCHIFKFAPFKYYYWGLFYLFICIGFQFLNLFQLVAKGTFLIFVSLMFSICIYYCIALIKLTQTFVIALVHTNNL